MLKENKILFLIVLYNKKIQESQSIMNLVKNSNLLHNDLIIIWDNSPIPDNDESSLIKLNYKIFRTPENISLSDIYNNCVDLYKYNFDNIWIFDDDSSIEKKMIELFKISIISNPTINLFLPKVKVENQIVSPGKFVFIKAKYFKLNISGIIPSKGIIGIMSGTCISMNFFIKYQYNFDTQLKIYGIDTKFYLDYCKKENNLFVIDYEMQHDLSFFTETNIDKIILKFKDHTTSLRKVIGNKSLFHFIFLELYINYLSIKYALKYKNTKFLF